MDEIEKNDFNLNISRYVSTVQAEEEIDLAAVHTDLLVVEKQIGEAKKTVQPILSRIGSSFTTLTFFERVCIVRNLRFMHHANPIIRLMPTLRIGNAANLLI